MFDFLLILWVSTMMWVNVTVTERELETQQHLEMVEDNMAEVWIASEQLTSKLKQCEKKKGRR